MIVDSAGDLLCDVAQTVLRQPEDLSVSEAATKYRFLNNVGSYVGPWDNSIAPYLVEPMDCLAMREYNAVIFVGPAQCGKTDMILNWITHGTVCDPADMILYEKSQTAARDFSRRRIDRLHRHSKAVGALLGHQQDSDNTFDKNYKNGMMLTLSWPTINELSGKPVPRVALTDYDRMPLNIDGEGSPFDLARKRTTTFKSFAKTFCESSPGHIVTDPTWVHKTPHEAPPCEGIFSLYNRGDRRRYYWPCPGCGQFFEPRFKHLHYPASNDFTEAAEAAVMVCPNCRKRIEHVMKRQLNGSAVWLKDGQTIDRNRRYGGYNLRSPIASFWLNGTAAAFASWQTLVYNFLKASDEFERTGSQESLKVTVNTDQGEPYFTKGTEDERSPEELKSNAVEAVSQVVPANVRFLIANADVQKNCFVVQVHGITDTGGITIIDRFNIVKSNRTDSDGDRLWVKPATNPEDWDLMVEQVINKEYELEGGEGFMKVMRATCDSGGRAGVTTQAYNFFRRLKKAGLSSRFLLTKGEPKPNAPRAELDYPDSTSNQRFAKARGEIPVLFLNVNVLKDTLNGALDRKDPTGLRIYLPDWLPDTFWRELTSEIKTPKGWVRRPGKPPNEGWDLLNYCVGMMVYLGIEKIDWNTPEKLPKYAQEWAKNPLVRLVPKAKPGELAAPVKTAAEQKKEKTGYNLSQLGRNLG